MIYQFKNGRGLGNLKAQAVGEELFTIHENHGSLTPAIVVEESRPKTAVLHPAFEWNDKKAAEEFRIHQARQIINCIHVVPETKNAKPVQAFINVRIYEDSADDPHENRGRAYLTAEAVAADDGLREQHLASIKGRLRNLRAEHASFTELAAVWSAVDQACE